MSYINNPRHGKKCPACRLKRYKRTIYVEDKNGTVALLSDCDDCSDCFGRSWTAKDASSVCTGFFIVITLFFAVLNFEFSTSKMQRDYQAAKELLTFNTATEWHKPTMVQNMKITVKFAKRCQPFLKQNNAQRFYDELEKTKNEDAKTALVSIFNYFESISLAVQQGIIDEDFIKGFFGSVFRTYYKDYFFYIDFRRKVKQNTKIWNNFTYLANKWTND